MIDRLPMGVALLDAAGRLLCLNRAGQAMVDARNGLRLQQGRLQAEQASEARRLAHALEAAVSGAPGPPQRAGARRPTSGCRARPAGRPIC